MRLIERYCSCYYWNITEFYPIHISCRYSYLESFMGLKWRQELTKMSQGYVHRIWICHEMFPHYWPLMWPIHWSQVDYPQIGQQCGSLVGLLLLAWSDCCTAKQLPVIWGETNRDVLNAWSNSYIMMTSSNGNIFRVTGHLCGEFTGLRWSPRKRPVTRSFDIFFDLRLNKRLSKQSWCWWFETLLCPLWRQRNGTHIPQCTIL